MDNRENKWAANKWIIILGSIFLFIILVGAYINYVIIYSKVYAAIESTQSAVEETHKTIIKTRNVIEDSQNAIKALNKTDSVVKIQLHLDKVLSETQNCQEFIYDKYSGKIKDLNNGIIDGNVLTFLFTVLLLFSGGFMIYIETEIKGQIEESKKQVILTQERINELGKDKSVTEKMLNRLDVEQTIIKLYTQIQMVRVFSTNTQCALAAKNYCIDKSTYILIYEIFKMTENLLHEFHNDKYKLITGDWKKTLDDIFESMIYAFEIDKIRENSENVGKTRPIEMVIDKIEELRSKISGLREID